MEDILTFKTPETRWLSNMTYVDIEHQGIVYPSTENFYHAIKYDKDDFCREVDYLITVRKYLAIIKPNEAKKYSRKHQMTNPKFEDNKLKIMLYAQRKKYFQEPFKSKLLDTGDCHIEEGNYHNDLYWGTDIKTRKGENNLGKIIMQVRAELRLEKQNV